MKKYLPLVLMGMVVVAQAQPLQRFQAQLQSRFNPNMANVAQQAVAIQGVNNALAVDASNYQTAVNAQKEQNIAAIQADASKAISGNRALSLASIADSLANPHITLTRDATLGQALDSLVRGLSLARTARNISTVNISPTVMLRDLGVSAMETGANVKTTQTEAMAKTDQTQAIADAAVNVSQNLSQPAMLPQGFAQLFPSGQVIPGYAH